MHLHSVAPIHCRRCRRVGVAALALAVGTLTVLAPGAAQAQIGLPGGLGRLPNLPVQTPALTQVPLSRLAQAEQTTAGLVEQRLRTVRELLRDNPETIEADPAGAPIRRAELVLIDPDATTLERAQASGFRVLRSETLEGLGLRQVIVEPPRGMGTAAGAARLREIDPKLELDFNHLYTRSGGEIGSTGERSAVGGTYSLPPAAAASATPTGRAQRVGLIDSGVDRAHPALREAPLHTWGCADRSMPSDHGTAVASLLVGRDATFAGALPGAALYAADVYCGLPTGGSAEAVAQALAWLAREQVAVVNVSLVGPPNRLLQRAVQASLERGHLVVAAVGNDGPAAPPLFPAAYAGVVGVTGVAVSQRVLPEAGQGTQVTLAAPGAEVAVARAGSTGYAVARGTSFAAPLVAGLLAVSLAQPDPAAAARTLQRLTASAQDLGVPGWDPVYGYGLVGVAARVAPERVQATRALAP